MELIILNAKIIRIGKLWISYPDPMTTIHYVIYNDSIVDSFASRDEACDYAEAMNQYL